VRTNFGGHPLKADCLMLNHSTVSWLVGQAFFSLEKVFRGLRFL
jgi:hypothetical protein